MDIRQEIANRIDKLPPEIQEEVLRFVASLGPAGLQGERGAVLRQFAGTLDHTSAQQMIQAIADECERVDASTW